MSVRHALWGILLASAASPAMAIAPAGSPCGAEQCPADTNPSQATLNAAYWSTITTDGERDKMVATIASHTSGRKTDWQSSASEYFNWRAATNHYNYDPTGKLHNYSAPPPPPWGEMRQAAEQAIRALLIDPSSAEFEWPHGFMQGYWKPLLQKRITGWITCGTVNAKNRLGGYVGRSTFVVVMDGTSVIYADMDSGNSVLVDIGCSKTMLPGPQVGMLDSPHVASPAGGVDVADEIAKLAALRDKGILTPAEFEAQKAKLLNQ